ncbi:MAG TPA: hypothetical protein VL463_10685 [Kofleriaceae bacterium]|nr:hypothetical protein [Kofleriaceae bacterium]
MAAAAPAADLVVFHAPSDAGPSVIAARDALAALARRRGVAWIDTSPAPPVPPETAQDVRQAIRDYDQLQFDTAIGELDRAASQLDRTGGAGLDANALSDLFLYRGLARVQVGDARAWDDLVEAAALAPSRALDPARFPPRAIETYTRAADAVRTSTRAKITVVAPDGCTIAIDAAGVNGPTEVAGGRHFVAVRCPGHRPWGAAVTAASGEVTVQASPELEVPPSDDELAIQARTAGATALVAIAVTGQPPVALMRRLDDRGVRDRASITLSGAHVADDAADALDHLLTPPELRVARERWYQKRWVWGLGGAAIVAAIFVPIVIFDDNGGGAGKVTLEPKVPW